MISRHSNYFQELVINMFQIPIELYQCEKGERLLN